MPKRKEMTRWQTNLLEVFDNGRTRVLSDRELKSFLQAHRQELDGPQTLTPGRMRSFLLDHGKLTREVLQPDPDAKGASGEPYPSRSRYLWGDPSPYSVALSLRANSYFTHASAIYLLGLSNEIPKTIYVNQEQRPKPQGHHLSQQAMDRAFRSKPRVSKYAYVYAAYRILLLSGKNTGRLEVTELEQPTGEFYPVTKVERTLIDSVVRPVYAGGIHHVRDVFESAREQVSINVLIATLKKLDYTYPYHQAIGFLMARTGYKENQLAKMRSLGLGYDFYLTNQIKDGGYDKEWRLHFPAGF